MLECKYICVINKLIRVKRDVGTFSTYINTYGAYPVHILENIKKSHHRPQIKSLYVLCGMSFEQLILFIFHRDRKIARV